jgi:hypothetical protein
MKLLKIYFFQNLYDGMIVLEKNFQNDFLDLKEISFAHSKEPMQFMHSVFRDSIFYYPKDYTPNVSVKSLVTLFEFTFCSY